MALARPTAGLLALTLTAAVMASAGAGGAASGAVPYVPCKAPKASGASVSWSFRASHGGAKSVTMGHGSYSSAQKISGTICHDDGQGAGAQRLTLMAVPGSAASLKRTVGVSATLVLPVKVSASDDPGCVVGTRGTVTIVSSYNSTHQDRASLKLKGGCSHHNASYTGAESLVSIPH